jgi:hypothetical protein
VIRVRILVQWTVNTTASAKSHFWTTNVRMAIALIAIPVVHWLLTRVRVWNTAVIGVPAMPRAPGPVCIPTFWSWQNTRVTIQPRIGRSNNNKTTRRKQ